MLLDDDGDDDDGAGADDRVELFQGGKTGSWSH